MQNAEDDDTPAVIDALDYASPGEAETSGWHEPVLCLLCGLCMCVPIVTGVIAISFARRICSDEYTIPQRSCAFFGVVFSLLNFLFWISAAVNWLRDG